MSKARFFLFFILLKVAVPYVVSAQSAPSWFTDKSKDYPDSRFITALGKGSSLENAKTMAIGEISLFFGASVNVRQEHISQFNYAMQSNGNNTSSSASKFTTMGSNTTITSQEDFMGVRFTTPYYNQQSGTWNVLGYINKEEAASLYTNRIAANRRFVEISVTQGEGEPELFRGLAHYQKAVAIIPVIEDDLNAVAKINPKWYGENSGLLSFIRKTESDYKNFCSRLAFGVRIEGDRQNRLQRKLSALFEKRGFVVAPNRAVYFITGGVSTFDAGEFSAVPYNVRADVALELRNARGDILFSYSQKYSRTGHLASMDAALDAAFLKIEKDLESNFIREFNSFLGD
jgi:hypothetical protein